MADITISVPAGATNRVLDAIAARHGYNPATDGTKAAFAKAFIIKLVKQEVRAYERDIAAKAAAATAETAVDSEISIT